MSVSVQSALRQSNGVIRLLEAHDRASTEIVQNTKGHKGQQFEGIWISGLTQTTYLGIPDTEIVSPLYRAILQATNFKSLTTSDHPICAAFDADSGGPVSDIPALVAVLVTIGVSMVIIEDKELKAPGTKVNSLLSANGSQLQADPVDFSKVIRAFKECVHGTDLMVAARIESFNVRIPKDEPTEEAASVKSSLEDARYRATMYTKAGADAIMIHSKSHSPIEVLEFTKRFREKDPTTPLVVVPTAYSKTLRKTLLDTGANVIIYANHLMRAKIHAVESITRSALDGDPNLFANEKEARACIEAGNYGCLLRILLERYHEDVKSDEVKQFIVAAHRLAIDNMAAAAMDLVMGTQSGCEADERIIGVKKLLKINAVQVLDI